MDSLFTFIVDYDKNIFIQDKKFVPEECQSGLSERS